MSDGFFFERGRLLFDLNGTYDPMMSGERSKSAEHSADERSKNIYGIDFENSQNLKKNSENES